MFLLFVYKVIMYMIICLSLIIYKDVFEPIGFFFNLIHVLLLGT